MSPVSVSPPFLPPPRFSSEPNHLDKAINLLIGDMFLVEDLVNLYVKNGQSYSKYSARTALEKIFSNPSMADKVLEDIKSKARERDNVGFRKDLISLLEDTHYSLNYRLVANHGKRKEIKSLQDSITFTIKSLKQW